MSLGRHSKLTATHFSLFLQPILAAPAGQIIDCVVLLLLPFWPLPRIEVRQETRRRRPAGFFGARWLATLRLFDHFLPLGYMCSKERNFQRQKPPAEAYFVFRQRVAPPLLLHCRCLFFSTSLTFDKPERFTRPETADRETEPLYLTRKPTKPKATSSSLPLCRFCRPPPHPTPPPTHHRPKKRLLGCFSSKSRLHFKPCCQCCVFDL